ncbi:Zn-ribbon domain-containing OB-fold protein [Streptomyces sp. NPDC048288]|uniref:Zn-ribbon domain-containing OB-fold protein n=1 Tax=Streptomyces sp. NPDC048288 TaxID=3365529 RepID=UPI00370FE6CA
MTLPAVRRDPATDLFFDATARGHLLLRRCTACGAHAAPPSDSCPRCRNATADWEPAAGTATVVSWTVVHGRTPGAERTAALVELTEGPWMYAALRGLRPGERPWAGMPVAVAFERPEGGEAIPVFHPADRTGEHTA